MLLLIFGGSAVISSTSIGVTCTYVLFKPPRGAIVHLNGVQYDAAKFGCEAHTLTALTMPRIAMPYYFVTTTNMISYYYKSRDSYFAIRDNVSVTVM